MVERAMDRKVGTTIPTYSVADLRSIGINARSCVFCNDAVVFEPLLGRYIHVNWQPRHQAIPKLKP